jgi:hypothetical protein
MNILNKQIYETSYTNKYIKHLNTFVCKWCSMYLFVYDVPCICLYMMFHTFVCICCSIHLFACDVPHIQTNAWNILNKQIQGTSYTNKYMEHHIQTNTWNIIMMFHVFVCIRCFMYLFVYDVSYICLFKMFMHLFV